MSFIQFYRDQKKSLPLPNPSEVKGGTFVVTGANTGLGYECAKRLVLLTASRVIIGVRSLRKGEDAKAKIEAETGIRGVIEVWHLDLSSYDSVKDFAREVNKLKRVDAIIENAAVALAEQTRSEGLETTLTVNVVSTLLLAVLVLPKLEETAKNYGITPHLVAIGSATAFENAGLLEKEEPNGDILDILSRDNANMGTRYPLSKLLELYAIRQLASLRPVSETGVVINYVNPGLCVTELDRNSGFVMWFIINFMRLVLGRTAEVGSRTLLHGALAGKESHGEYLSECEVRDFRVPSWITNEAGAKMQRRVWESVSRKLNAIQPGCI